MLPDAPNHPAAVAASSTASCASIRFRPCRLALVPAGRCRRKPAWTDMAHAAIRCAAGCGSARRPGPNSRHHGAEPVPVRHPTRPLRPSALNGQHTEQPRTPTRERRGRRGHSEARSFKLRPLGSLLSWCSNVCLAGNIMIGGPPWNGAKPSWDSGGHCSSFVNMEDQLLATALAFALRAYVEVGKT